MTYCLTPILSVCACKASLLLDYKPLRLLETFQAVTLVLNKSLVPVYVQYQYLGQRDERTELQTGTNNFFTLQTTSDFTQATIPCELLSRWLDGQI